MIPAELTREQLAEAIEFAFSRDFGISSDGMLREALGLPQRGWWEARPWDSADSAGVEETYAAAPSWLRKRMLSRLAWYREIAYLGWPTESPPRAKDAA